MKKFISILLAFFFVHATAMPSMMSFADEAKKCPMMNMSLSVEEDINNNTHECCTPDAAFVYFSIFQKEKQSVIPLHITDLFTAEIQQKIDIDAFQYTKKYIPDIFLQYKKIIVMRV